MQKERIALITDSTCDLPLNVLEKYGIHLLPLRVVYDDREYLDRLEIQPEEVCRTVAAERPRTSLPSAGETRELLERLKSEGFTGALAVHISFGLSGTGEMVRTVARQMADFRVEVIDSRALSMALGFMVLEAAQGIQDGLGLDELVRRVQSIRDRMHVFFVVETLEYLRRGGRIGYVQATLGQVLDVKPVISINEEGKYYSVDKVRGRKRSLARLVELFRRYAAGKRVKLAVMHAAALEEAKRLLRELTAEPETTIEEAVLGQIGPGMVVHTGPGLVGLAFYEV